MSTVEDLWAAYKTVFNSADGEVVLHDLETRFHIETPVFSNDPYETAFRDGQRSVVLLIRSLLRDRPAIKDIIDHG
tara:strand:+ start:128 stop:355 length:228 start_codon:yes stop_codon:yes gene_type:complete